MRVPLVLPPGIVVDDTTAKSAGGYCDADKVRFWRDLPQTVGGWEKLSDTLLTGVCRGLLLWTDNTGNINVAFGTHSNLQLWLGGDLYDITPSGLAAGAVDAAGGAGFGTGAFSTGDYGSPSLTDFFPRSWSLAGWGQNLLASPRNGTIYAWTNNPATPAAAITNAPAQCQAMLVTPQRQVMALGCNQEADGIFNPRCIRWSDIEDFTDWTTLPTNNAGEYILPGNGRIVGGKVTAHGLFIWTDNGLWQGTYLGAEGQTYQFDLLGEGCGLIGPNAAAVIGQTAFWISPAGQFYSCSLDSAPSPLVCPIARDMMNNLATVQKDKIYASTCSEFAEVRWDYPDARDGVENSRYVVLNTWDGSLTQRYTIAGAWSRGLMDRSAMIDAGAGPYPVGVSPDGAVYWHERGQSDDGGAFTTMIATADQALSDDTGVFIRGFWPDFKDQVGTVSVSVITRHYPQGPETTHGPFAMPPGKQKVDFRATGRIARVQFSATSSPTFWRLGRPTFDVDQAGAR